MRRFCTGLMALLLLCSLMAGNAQALTWPAERTANEQALKTYIEKVNLALDRLKGEQVNSVFECYDTFASLGVTSVNDSDTPENVQITVSMGRGLEWIEVSSSSMDGFANLCAAFIAVAAGDEENPSKYLADPKAYVTRVSKNPSTSFEDHILYARSEKARTYFAYSPSAYADSGSYLSGFGDSSAWLTMTLIFPLQAETDAGVEVTPVPPKEQEVIRDGSDDDGDYTPYDEGTHFEIFLTPTPEPDSAAGYLE